MEPAPFSVQFSAPYANTGPVFTFQKVDVGDTLILNVMVDGIVDTTVELPLNSQQAINILSDLSNFEDFEESMGIEPRIIVGDHNNYKIQVVASQIGKVLLKSLSEPKSVILSIGGRWFGKGDETSDEDFEKLMFVLENVGKLLKKT